MYERFTDRSRRVVVLAQELARKYQHGSISSAHLLLALIQETIGIGARTMEAFGIDEKAVKDEFEQTLGIGSRFIGGHLPFTPDLKEALNLALHEAMNMGNNFIGTEHLALGLVRLSYREPRLEVVRKLFDLHRVSLEAAREKVMELQQEAPALTIEGETQRPTMTVEFLANVQLEPRAAEAARRLSGYFRTCAAEGRVATYAGMQNAIKGPEPE